MAMRAVDGKPVADRERGDGYIFRRPGSRFFGFRFYVDGVPVKGSTGESDEKKAWKVLDRKREAMKRGDEVPGEERLRLRDLGHLLDDDYAFKQNRSTPTMKPTWKHLTAYFGDQAKALRLGSRIEPYVAERRAAGAAEGSVRIELALLNRAFHLAVLKKRLSPSKRPLIQLPPEDPNSVRQGFFRRAAMEALCGKLPPHLAAVVAFLFWCPWRIGAARRVEWRDYSAADQTLTKRHAINKDKRHAVVIPVDPENTPQLMAVIERQQERRRPDCPFIFHAKTCGPARYDKHGNRRPCLGDFQKTWNTACAALGMAGRIPHDLRRSGIKHYVESGVPPHIVMRWSGHRTMSTFLRYAIIDLDDLRRAGKQASDYQGKPTAIRLFPAPETRTGPGPSKIKGSGSGRR